MSTNNKFVSIVDDDLHVAKLFHEALSSKSIWIIVPNSNVDFISSFTAILTNSDKTRFLFISSIFASFQSSWFILIDDKDDAISDEDVEIMCQNAIDHWMS